MPAKTAAADHREERRNQVATLLKAGCSQREIARTLRSRGYRTSAATVNRDVEVLRGRWRDASQGAIQEALLLDLARLDDLLKGVTLPARNGSFQAIDRVLSIIRLRGEILGYSAAKRLDLTGKDGRPIGIENDSEELFGELAARAAALAQQVRSTPPGKGQDAATTEHRTPNGAE